MTKPSEKLVEFPQASARDVLTDVLRTGAQRMLATAIEAEVDVCLATGDAAGNGHRLDRISQAPLAYPLRMRVALKFSPLARMTYRRMRP